MAGPTNRHKKGAEVVTVTITRESKGWHTVYWVHWQTTAYAVTNEVSLKG